MQSKGDRANQFLPFDALKGLEIALREKEIVYEPKKELSEEAMEDISNTINELEKGDIISITYYRKGTYEKVLGKFVAIDLIRRRIKIIENEMFVDIRITEIIDLAIKDN